MSKDKARLAAKPGFVPRVRVARKQPAKVRKVNRLSGGTNRQSLGKLYFQEPRATRVIEVNRVMIGNPDGFETHAPGTVEAEVHPAIPAAADECGLSQTELVLQDVFPLA
jgi:hypothetical protein